MTMFNNVKTSASPMELPKIRQTLVNVQDMALRFRHLDRKPGGRESMTRAELVEYDTLGGALSDMRTALGASHRTFA